MLGKKCLKASTKAKIRKILDNKCTQDSSFFYANFNPFASHNADSLTFYVHYWSS